MTGLENFREEKDEFFATNRQSPLTAEQKRQFKGLSYFLENPDLALEVTVEEFEPKTQVSLQTSTGDEQVYQRFGKFSFTIDGQEVSLTIYANLDGGFFLPFMDVLAGRETYSAGRYLEPELLEDGHFLVDFNLAYNPYCAYNDRWSCPLTPAENRLKVAIRAGEKIFQGAGH